MNSPKMRAKTFRWRTRIGRKSRPSWNRVVSTEDARGPLFHLRKIEDLARIDVCVGGHPRGVVTLVDGAAVGPAEGIFTLLAQLVIVHEYSLGSELSRRPECRLPIEIDLHHRWQPWFDASAQRV